ncbi:MAG: hypothetical protein WA753_12870, partial [Pseudolabrys sp.]
LHLRLAMICRPRARTLSWASLESDGRIPPSAIFDAIKNLAGFHRGFRLIGQKRICAAAKRSAAQM